MPTVVLGDTLTMAPPQGSLSISAISGAQLLASGIPQIVITNEAASGNFSQLQVLPPGEANAPNTTTGKTGTPTFVTLFGASVEETVTVLAVDACWNPVPGITNTISITSTDAGAMLPKPAAMVNGSITFGPSNPFSFADSGTWTVTATDQTTSTITPATSSAVAVGP